MTSIKMHQPMHLKSCQYGDCLGLTMWLVYYTGNCMGLCCIMQHTHTHNAQWNLVITNTLYNKSLVITNGSTCPNFVIPQLFVCILLFDTTNSHNKINVPTSVYMYIYMYQYIYNVHVHSVFRRMEKDQEYEHVKPFHITIGHK